MIDKYDIISFVYKAKPGSFVYNESAKLESEDVDRIDDILQSYRSRNKTKQHKNAHRAMMRLASTSTTRGQFTRHPEYALMHRIKSTLDKEAKYESIKSSMVEMNKLWKYLHDAQMVTVFERGFKENIQMTMIEYITAEFLLIDSIRILSIEHILGVDGNIQEKYDVLRMLPKWNVHMRTYPKYAEIIRNAMHSTITEGFIDNSPIFLNENNPDDMKSTPLKIAIDIYSLISKAIRFARMQGLAVFRLLKNTAFGIIPIVQYIAYRHHSKKVNRILSMEQTAELLSLNIQTLQTDKSMPEEQKQKAIKKQELIRQNLIKRAQKQRAILLSDGVKANEDFDILSDDNVDNNSGGEEFSLESFSSSDNLTFSISIFGETRTLPVRFASFINSEEEYILMKDSLNIFIQENNIESAFEPTVSYIADRYTHWNDNPPTTEDIRNNIWEHMSVDKIYVDYPILPNKKSMISLLGETKSDPEHGIGIGFKEGIFALVASQDYFL